MGSKMPSTTLPDGSELFEPTPCDRCGALAYLVLRALNPDKPETEVLTFQCPVCGHRMERTTDIDKQGNELSSPWFCPLRAGLSMRKISEYQDHAAECRKIAARTRDLTRKEQ